MFDNKLIVLKLSFGGVKFPKNILAAPGVIVKNQRAL